MKITVGMATYQDFDGVYFTLAAFQFYQQLNHPVELLVVDSLGQANKDEVGCPLTKKAATALGARYVHAPHAKGTAAPRELVFREATGDVVICLDCHVLLEQGAINAVADFFADPVHAKDMLQGPLLGDDRATLSSHFEPVWRKRMYGRWAKDDRVTGPHPFEIPMQGLGMFAMRAAAWPGFNPAFRGFGGEEGYIHAKVRRNGGKCYCHPACRWMHRFGRPGGVPYPMRVADRIFNYVVGRKELGEGFEDVIEHFAGLGDTAAVQEAVEAVAAFEAANRSPLKPLRGWPQPAKIDFQAALVPPPEPPADTVPAVPLQPVRGWPRPAADRPLGAPAPAPPAGPAAVISCLCATFGRGGTPAEYLLEEAVHSFALQTDANSELLILNDDPMQTLVVEAPRVTVFNLPRRFPTFGEKLNFLAAMAAGPLLCEWDDDDISLPWRLELSRKLLGTADYLNPRQEWLWHRDAYSSTHPQGNCFHSSLFTRRAFTAIRGVVQNSTDSDQDADWRLREAAADGQIVLARPDPLPVEQWYYVYRWGVADHLSAGAKGDETYARRALVRRPAGRFVIRPGWKADYVAATRAAARPAGAAA